MSKPSETPEWASSGSADITEPLLSKKQQGWVVEQPAHDVFNWWMNLVYQWLVWLAGFESTAHTWTVVQTFSAGVIIVGNSSLTGNVTVAGSTTTGPINATALTLPNPAFVYVNAHGGSSPAFASSDVVNISGNQKTCYWKNPDGSVSVHINVAFTSATAKLLFTLPSGFYAAGTNLEFPGAVTGTDITVETAGNVVASAGSAITGIEAHFTFHPAIALTP